MLWGTGLVCCGQSFLQCIVKVSRGVPCFHRLGSMGAPSGTEETTAAVLSCSLSSFTCTVDCCVFWPLTLCGDCTLCLYPNFPPYVCLVCRVGPSQPASVPSCLAISPTGMALYQQPPPSASAAAALIPGCWCRPVRCIQVSASGLCCLRHTLGVGEWWGFQGCGPSFQRQCVCH